MFKSYFQKISTLCTLWFLSGCGRVAYDLSSPKAVAAPVVQPEAFAAIAVNTLLNILSNSLLEMILVIIAIVLYLRYQSFKRQHKSATPKNETHSFIDLKANSEAWHFNEEEKQ